MGDEAVKPDPTLAPGDIVLFRGSRWLSRAIRWATADPVTGEKAVCNHVALVASAGEGIEAEIIEALGHVERHKLAESAKDGPTILVFRPLNIPLPDLDEIVRYADSRVGQRYGWGKLGLFLFDSLLSKARGKDVFFFRHFFGKKNLVCSSLVAEAYLSAGYAFGCESITAAPEDIYKFCAVESDKYALIWYKDFSSLVDAKS